MMRPPWILLEPIYKPTIVNSSDLRRYVVIVTALATFVAVSVDVMNQLTFFVDWSTTLRSWCLTELDVLITAIPISLMIGRSQRELQAAKRVVEVLSRTDLLTGLPNRRALLEQIETDLPQTMVLAIVDIDRFKTINDTYGHRAGDAVIRATGDMMAALLTPFGMVGRLGGEEFALVSATDRIGEMVAAVVQFRERIEQSSVMSDGMVMSVTISAGIATCHPEEPFERLYSEADEALYRAKRSGRNRIALSPRMEVYAHLVAERTANAA